MLEFPRWKQIMIWSTLVLAILFSLPNLLSKQTLDSLPSWLPKKQLSLGLDLQGGSYMLLQVDTDDVIATRLKSMPEEIRSTLREIKGPDGTRVGISNYDVGAREVSFIVRDIRDVDSVVEAVRKMRQPVGDGISGQYDTDVTIVDSNRIVMRLTDAGIIDRKKLAVDQSLEVMRKRIDTLGTKETDISKQGQERIKVEVPGLQDAKALRDIIGKTAKLEFKLTAENISPEDVTAGRLPPGVEALPSVENSANLIPVSVSSILTGENLIDAKAEPDTQNGNGYQIAFRLDTLGARKFGKITTENIGKPFAIILDGKVLSAPTIQSAILGGSGVITGNFTPESATQLAGLLRAGALPAKLSIIEERTVGPSLGKDSIDAGKRASIIGTGLVIALMVLTYARFGLFATAALGFNLALIIGALSLIGATLTLPGIAGMVLTVGTAVDANVLIYERIREEIRNGRNTLSAVEAGYREASTAIFDANISNVIAASMMILFGSGPIKGFAVVLSIGIATSVFTGVTFTRLLTAYYMRSARPQKLVL
jgi:preprotein translocase subunit SecD